MHPGSKSLEVNSEEDLLALQKEFLEKKLPSSVKVKRVTRPSHEEENVSQNVTPLQALEKLSILEDVREMGANISINSAPERKKKSLFARRKESERESKNKLPLTEVVATKPSNDGLELDTIAETRGSDLPRNGRFSKEIIEEISKENERLLACMSPDEIIMAKEELLKSLDPNFVRILTKGQSFSRSPSLSSRPLSEPLNGSQQSKIFEGLLEAYSAEGLNRLAIESEKLQWMRDDVPAPASKNAIRFSFDGIPLRGDVDIPTHHGLHHHGMDPEKPGYTLDELSLLARSSVPGQRGLALGILNRVFQNIHDELLSAEDFTAIRRHFLIESGVLLLCVNLDVKWHSVIMAAIRVMHSWLVGHALYLGHSEVPNIDERILSLLSCLIGGHKAVSNAVMCDSRISDAEAGEDVMSSQYQVKLAAYDSVAGFLSMGVPFRFQYLFGLLNLPHIYHAYMIEILLRMARHSIWACSKLCKCPELFVAIDRRYFQISWPPIEQKELTGASAPLPSPIAIRFFTAICQASIQFARQLLSTTIFQSLNRFLEADIESLPLDLQPLGIQLQAEILQLGRVLAIYDMHDVFVKQVPALLAFAPPPSPAQAFFYRWKEALVLSLFVLPLPEIQQRWLYVKPSFFSAYRLLSDTGLPRDPSLASAVLDFISACITLKQAKLITDDTPEEISHLVMFSDLINSISSEANEALKSLPSLKPTRSGVWNKEFRRFVPAIATPRQMSLLEEMAEIMPRVSLIRSLMEVARVSKHGVNYKNYKAIYELLSQLLGAIGCLEQQCWHLLLPIFDLAFWWLQLEAPSPFRDIRCAVAVWYIVASFDKGDKLDDSLLEQLHLTLPHDYSFVGTYYESSEPAGLLDDYVCACTYDDQVFWGLHELNLDDVFKLVAALKETTHVYSLFAPNKVPTTILRAISQRLNPRADVFAIMKIFSAPHTTFFHPLLIEHLLPLLEAIRVTENWLACSNVLKPAEDDHVLSRRFEIYKDAIDRYLNCGFFHSAFLPIFLHPLDMAHFPWDFRAVFWGDLIDNIAPQTKKYFGTFDAIPKAYLYPIETSFVVLDIMASAICCRSLTRKDSPFLYGIACHHLQHALQPAKTGRLAQLRMRLESSKAFDASA
ncbi:hypothetical protein DSO57_1030900 [Entomophthora muscae]|nr:hypothetical protein DSO57_1030900 [Entomophthora muscae]